LVNERTYLAWLRTAAANVMVLGLAIIKFAEGADTGGAPADAAGIVLAE
jgi:uncharacterized membrane protein YidH (DUF202 family)